MKTFTVLIREVVTTHRRVQLKADSEDEAVRQAIALAANGKYKTWAPTSLTVSAFPLLSTLERTDD